MFCRIEFAMDDGGVYDFWSFGRVVRLEHIRPFGKVAFGVVLVKSL